MLFFLNIYKTSDSMVNHNISKYLNIKFQIYVIEMNNGSYYQTMEFNTRPCLQNDFGNDKKGINNFNKMNNEYYLLLCPDI